MTIAFNEAVRGFAADDIDFTGTASATAALAGIGKVYTATVASSLEGTLRIQVPAGVAYDAANNGNTISTRHTVQIDAVAPTVTIDVPTTAQGRDFAVTVTFSESVTGFVQSELFLSGAGATVAAFNGSGTDYEATITPVGSQVL